MLGFTVGLVLSLLIGHPSQPRTVRFVERHVLTNLSSLRCAICDGNFKDLPCAICAGNVKDILFALFCYL